jgi:hypothetical protein
MGKAIPSQHPAVVLRSHYTQVRALLAVAMIAIVGLSVAVVILANESDEVGTSAGSISVAAPAGTTRYDGGPEEGTRDLTVTPPVSASDSALATRYDGGPEEGTRDLTVTPSGSASDSAPAARYDGGPEEGSAEVSPAPQSGALADGLRYDGGPDEGTRGPGTN